MILSIRAGVLLFSVVFVKTEIYLHNTEDGLNVEFYDCVFLQSLTYCRRPKESIDLFRDNDTHLCEQNGGQLHRLSELRSQNISITTILDQWKSGLERVEQYSRYLSDAREPNGYVCECVSPVSFGKNCEYQIPMGKSLTETLDRQMGVRNKNRRKAQLYADLICYETLQCDSGLLCLDWREICDGIQQCLEGRDEENCDLLEMNECEQDEYRCLNGMCVPDEFFLDGEFDCLDRSDELALKTNENCGKERVSSKCDDRICLPNSWSCGDGECIPDRLAFQKATQDPSCHSGRDRSFLCETDSNERQWTMANGRCFGTVEERYDESSVTNRSVEELCEYHVKCALSRGAEIGCSCNRTGECFDKVKDVCHSASIRYPRGSIVAPFLFFLFNRTRVWKNKLPDSLLINGTVRCGHSFVTVTKRILFEKDFNVRRIVEVHFCRPSRTISSSENLSSEDRCHRQNESLDRCSEWNPCLSISRMNDGWADCLDSADERQQTQMQIDKTCAQVRRHRFRCSREQPTCLLVMKLADQHVDCRNKFDQLWLGIGRDLSSIGCHQQRQDECSLLRQYISQSWTSTPINHTDVLSNDRIPFRSYCDTFWDLPGREDENLRECSQWWICPEGQRRCGTGQCFYQSWASDDEWDCADASDEHDRLQKISVAIFKSISRQNSTNQSDFVASSCSQSSSFFCLSSRASRQVFSCLNFTQIGDGIIDCLGALDERMTVSHCSDRSSMLANHFLCPSTNSCIPYSVHCLDDHRCPNRSDDQLWCDREHRATNCSAPNGFTCFNGRCVNRGRCDVLPTCPFVEDEYMCHYSTLLEGTLSSDRQMKESLHRTTKKIVRLPAYPPSPPATSKSAKLASDSMSTDDSSLSPYWCNRGLGILSPTSRSPIICFCPPQYYGDQCQFHADRLSVVLHVDRCQSTIDCSLESGSMSVLQVVVLLLSNDDVLLIDHFPVVPSSESTSLLLPKAKFSIHFVYPRSSSSSSVEERRERFFNRSSLLHDHRYSIRIELYRRRTNEQLELSGVWKYPLSFSHLPVFRLAKVLRLSRSVVDQFNPCSSNPCGRNGQCHQLMNNKSQFICLCQSNFTGENCSEEDARCVQGYCSRGSLCQPNSRLSRRDDSPPFCLCPLNRFGRRCEIEHSSCLSNPCLNQGSCVPHSQADQVICLCPREYRGSHCQWRKPSIELSISESVSHRAAVIQYLQIDFVSLHLILVGQQVFARVPSLVQRFHYDQKALIPDIVVLKLYSSDETVVADLYLLSVHLNLFSFRGTTQISRNNECQHRRTFENDSSPIRYHQICIANRTRLCFRDDLYLCICAQNPTRVECFLLEDQLDRCEHCRANARCLKGDPRQSNDFLCLCPECHSGRQCQFSTKSFSFTLDQLFSPDLLDHRRRTTTIALLIFFSLLGFFLSIPNNLFSFLTLRRRPCLRYGIGHYLLTMSVVNQLSLALLAARLIHLAFLLTSFRSSPSVDHLFCKLLGYLLTCLTRLSSWLPAFVALERVYTTVFLNKQWFKQPHIARCLMFFILVVILLSSLDELLFVKSFTGLENGNSTLCVTEYPPSHQPMWIFIHQFVSVTHFLFPLLIKLFSTLTIMSIVIKSKINIRQIDKTTSNKPRRTVIRNVLTEHREMITRPAITLIPSIFSLFSLPFLIISFSLGCQNLDENPLRCVLIIFYLVTFVPQMLMFYLYIYPSSFYWKEWQLTTIHQHIAAVRRHQQWTSDTTLSINNEQKTQDLSSVPNQK